MCIHLSMCEGSNIHFFLPFNPFSSKKGYFPPHISAQHTLYMLYQLSLPKSAFLTPSNGKLKTSYFPPNM